MQKFIDVPTGHREFGFKKKITKELANVIYKELANVIIMQTLL